MIFNLVIYFTATFLKTHEVNCIKREKENKDKIPKTWAFGLKAKKATIQEELKRNLDS